LNVTYSDNTSEILTVTVSAVLNAFATNLSPAREQRQRDAQLQLDRSR
jgi:hypothetical protein